MISAGSAAGVGYYAGGGGSEEVRDASGRNYYTGAVDHGERPGQWSGKLAEALGLTGEIRPADMAMVYEQFLTPDGQPIGNGPRNYQSSADRLAAALAKGPDALPERIEEIRLDIERSDQSTCRGVDLTFSVPKSVTVAYVAAWRAEQAARADDADGQPDGSGGQSDGSLSRADGFAAIREAIDGAILDANQAGLDYVAGIATTRTGKHGAGYVGQWVQTPGLIITSFPQLTSRADDPQYHIHNVILNRGQTADGKIGALDTRDLGQQRHAYSAVADRMLAERLQDAGILVAMRPDGMAREIVGIDQGYLDAFSQRRAQITRAMAPVVEQQEERLGRELNNLERSRLAQTINLVTREAKDETDIDWAAKLEYWQDRITDEIGAGLGPVAEHLRAMVDDNAGGTRPVAGFSQDAVIAQAIHTVAQGKAAWSRADLILELDRALPDRLGLSMEQTVALLGRLTDTALGLEAVVQVAGKAGTLPPVDLVAGSLVRPSDALYAAPETMEAEGLILRAAVERGRGPVAGLGPKGLEAWRGGVDAWLTENYPTIGADQRAAVVGLASTDAALAQLIGPAGTGKSFAAGALAGAWGHVTDGGRVIGLAVSEAATDVLRGDGVTDAYNVAAWKAHAHEVGLGPDDILLLDETSMVGTADLDLIRGAAERAGARVVAMGDPRQLGSVGAGGAMGLISGKAETYTLSDVRRFGEEWEGPASLGLREGSLDAVREYDVHGRLVEAGTMDDAMAGAARAAAAERLSGRTVSVTADTNRDAWRVGDLVREQLVAAGVVDDQGIILRSEQVAGIGDQVLTRQIDRGLGVLNGSRFDVVGTGEDGSLSVVGDDGVVRELPASYVQAVTGTGTPFVQLGYASTVHSAQGKTVDVSYTVTGGNTSAAALYVGMTRGRDRNTAFVALQATEPTAGRLDAGSVKVEEQQARPSAVTVLADALERETESRAAHTEQEIDAARLGSMATILPTLEEVTHLACRARLDGDLDRLVEDGALTVDARARLGADQSTDHLSRVCRAAEQAGLDPAAVLREALEDRDLAGLRSLAQGVAARITSAHDVTASQPGTATIPARLPDTHREYLENLHEQAAGRARDLGSQAAAAAPTWAVRELGPVPDDAADRLAWEDRAGAVAAFREAKGLEESDRAIPSAPGLSQTEARAAWWGAWDALGRPQETRSEAGMTDGALRARVAAWEREQAWAPPHANASLRQAELDAEEARHEAVLARATGDEDAATRWEQEAAERQSVADVMATVADARGEWVEEVAVTQDFGERAAAELAGRGLAPGAEDDRVSAEEWLEHQREVDARDEAVRDITELDVPLVDDSTVMDSDGGVTEDEGTDVSGETLGSAHSPEESGHDAPAEDRAAPRAVESGTADGDGTPDVKAVDGAEPSEDEPREAAEESAPAGEGPPVEAVREAQEPADEPEREARPARVEASTHPDDAELDALVAIARDDRVADRASEAAAHDAWEAEQEQAAERDAEDDAADEYVAGDVPDVGIPDSFAEAGVMD